MATTIILKDGDLGSERIMVRCDLTRAESPVMVDYCEGSGWEPTQWQCADACHRSSGLADIGMDLAAQAIQIDRAEFDCDWSVLVEANGLEDIRTAVALEGGADTDYEAAEHWYDSYGWHLTTEDAGDVMLQAVEWDWLDGTDEEAVDRLLVEQDDASRDEAESLVAKAREIRDAAESICGSLDEAVVAYQAGRLDRCRRALLAAYSEESDHGDAPATLGLARKLLLCEGE